MTTLLPQGVEAGAIALTFGHPDPEAIPWRELLEAVAGLGATGQAHPSFGYGPEQGPPELLAFLAARLSQQDGIAVTPDNVMITAGATQAVDMITRLFAEPGRPVLVEAPSYRDALYVLRDYRVPLVSIPVDEHGLRVDALEDRLRALRARGGRPSLLYTIPNFQNPTGTTLPEDRRRAILKLARDYGFLIVEDDVYRELAFDEPPPRRFYGLAGGSPVISVGSFSKVLGPGLRVGWLTAEPALVERCVNCGTSQMGGGASPFAASAVAAYCAKGLLDAHLDRLRGLYRERRDVMLEALDTYLAGRATWTRPGGGFFVWLTLPEGVRARAVQAAARARGLLLSAGDPFFAADAPDDRHLRLAFSFAPLDALREGARILAEVIEAEMSKI